MLNQKDKDRHEQSCQKAQESKELERMYAVKKIIEKNKEDLNKSLALIDSEDFRESIDAYFKDMLADAGWYIDKQENKILELEPYERREH